jgi:hypothetical protein
MRRLIAPTIAILALALPAAAAANVLIYGNAFKSKDDFIAISKFQGGGKCKHEWKGKKALGLRVTTGQHECLWATPVQGDSKRPDLTVQAAAKVLKKTNKKIRKDVYTGLAVRLDRRTSYEARVFPKGRRYQLLKNGDVVHEGKNSAIKALDDRNLIRLQVEDDTVLARVNGKRLSKLTDESPQEVSGRKTALTFGNEAKRKKTGYAVFDNVKVFVPDP